MITIENYIAGFSGRFIKYKEALPWYFIQNISYALTELMPDLDSDYSVTNNNVAIHKSAMIEEGVILKDPVVIGANCFIGAHAYLRGGVYLSKNTSIGPGCEIKSSIVFNSSSLAHFNFIGDSIIGSHVNFEAGAVIANHYNERTEKTIHVLIDGKKHAIEPQKFGALVGDNSKIGANAVLSPGTLLEKNSIVKRLELVEQC
jgi:NDP-sugar pyrophosphorylase family protein